VLVTWLAISLFTWLVILLFLLTTYYLAWLCQAGLWCDFSYFFLKIRREVEVATFAAKSKKPR
jgi:hypothetical protein